MKNNGTDEEFEGYDQVSEDELYTELDDDRRAELDEMVGLKVVGVELWEESLGDDEEGGPVDPEDRTFFDCDLFLEDNLALELYVASVYEGPDSDDPVVGMDNIYDVVGRLADDDMELMDFDQADDEGGLYLAFGHGDAVELVLVSSAWMVSEWEEEEEEEGENAANENG
jgi:hypothetical protein